MMLCDMLPEKLEDYILKGIIQIAPLAFMRGEPWIMLL
jgi:phosphate starvation-inducible PhoH-like protein